MLKWSIYSILLFIIVGCSYFFTSFAWSKYEFSKSENFEKIHIAKSDYSKIKNNEISIDGIMYDIKSIHQTINGYELMAYRDQRESDILHFLSKIKNQKLEVGILNLLALLTLHNNVPFKSDLTCIIIKKTTIISNQTYSNPFIEYFSPPPEKSI